MTSVSTATLAGDYLSVLQALSEEIDEAMSALARNSCSDFQEHVARQESLCNEMNYLVQGLVARIDSSTGAIPQLLDPQLATRIRDAQTQLQRLNRCYAGLLASSSRTVAALSALCRTSLDQFRFSTTELPKQQTWSCEV